MRKRVTETSNAGLPTSSSGQMIWTDIGQSCLLDDARAQLGPHRGGRLVLAPVQLIESFFGLHALAHQALHPGEVDTRSREGTLGRGKQSWRPYFSPK